MRPRVRLRQRRLGRNKAAAAVAAVVEVSSGEEEEGIGKFHTDDDGSWTVGKNKINQVVFL